MERRGALSTSLEQWTSRRHAWAVAAFGVVAGIFLLNPFVIVKRLGGHDWHVTILLLVPALAQFVAVLWSPLDPRRPLGRRPFTLFGIPVHLLLFLPALGLLAHDPTAIVLILATCAGAQMLLVPVQNGILARNYGAATRGRRFGAATAVQATSIVVVSLGAGRFLDLHPEAWPWLYALAAVAAVVSYRLWSTMHRRIAAPLPSPLPNHTSPLAALRDDRPFRQFEGSFMLYGLGFLMLQPVLPIYLSEDLGVSYTEAAVATGAIFWIAMIITSPLAGRLADRIGILRLAAIAFGSLAAFPLTLLAWPTLGGLYVAYALFGIAMSGVFLAWTMGPMHFAGPRDALPYLNAHLGLVGLRALVGLIGGTLIQQSFGSRTVFVVAAGFELAAAAHMLTVARADALRRAVA